ncbi:MAG: hypothetical protein H6869_10925 [Rhodospirillales bacterium]|nr:hypothetical protein [Rhodospirillales bacterium]
MHELRFDRAQKSVTTYDFSIINTESGESYFGKITYGNGYSVPQTSIDISCRDDGDNTDNNCRYHGIPYEIKGKDTTYAFSVDYNTQNPILFPDLHRAFYGKRNNPGLDSDHLPKNIWLFKGCVEKTTSP